MNARYKYVYLVIEIGTERMVEKMGKMNGTGWFNLGRCSIKRDIACHLRRPEVSPELHPNKRVNCPPSSSPAPMARFGREHVLPDPAASSEPDPPPFLSAALSPSKFSSTVNSRKDPADRRIPEPQLISSLTDHNTFP